MSKATYQSAEKYYKNKRANRKKYYDKTVANGVNRKKKYTPEEEQMILEHKISDRELSAILGRSMKAIHNKRALLKKERTE